jgi:hypothetical protein
MILPKQIRHKRMHTGGRKQNRRIIVRQQALALNLRVTLALKKSDKFGTKFRCCHTLILSAKEKNIYATCRGGVTGAA